MTQKIAVIGDGAMGTVCSLILARKGFRVGLWGYQAAQVQQFQTTRKNERFLPGVTVPVSVEVTDDDAAIFAEATVLYRSIVIVIGPTPPGTGVIKLAFSLTASKSTSPTRR